MGNDILLPSDDVKCLDEINYSGDILEFYSKIPEIAKPLLKDANITFKKIEKMLYSAPSILKLIKTSMPEEILQAMLTGEQKRKLANGALKLMTKKDGTLMANLINPHNKKIVATIPLKNVKTTPKLTQAITDYAMQMQMAQIAEQMQIIQAAVEEIRQGQEYDRLAKAYSCQQKLLQAVEIKDTNLKEIALLRIASDAEDSRNLLMLSQKSSIIFLTNQPYSFLGKVFSGTNPEKLEYRINEIRENLCAVNMVSLVEAIAYQGLGETSAAQKSLNYYADFINSTYLAVPGLVERLDLIDSSPVNYWSKTLPDIEKKINALPFIQEQKLIKKGE